MSHHGTDAAIELSGEDLGAFCKWQPKMRLRCVKAAPPQATDGGADRIHVWPPHRHALVWHGEVVRDPEAAPRWSIYRTQAGLVLEHEAGSAVLLQGHMATMERVLALVEGIIAEETSALVEAIPVVRKVEL
jgi:hypothetical protein